MCIWNKILIGFIAVAAIAFFYLGARALKTHAHWRSAIAAHEAKLGFDHPLEPKGLAKQEAELKKTLSDLDLELHKLYLNRPRIWSDVRNVKAEPTKDDKGNDTMLVSLSVESQPVSEQEFKDFNLWLFENRDVDKEGRYLGEFIVTAVAGKQVQLRPAKPLTDWQIERLRGNLGPCIIYEHLPVDDYDAFDGVLAADLPKLLPASSQEEYARRIEYAKSRKGGSKEKGQAQKTENPSALRDYAVCFGAFYSRRAAWSDTMQALRRDADAIKKDLDLVTAEVAIRDKEIDTLNEELTVETRKRDVMAAHLKALESKLRDVLAVVEELKKNNRALVAATAKIMQEAVGRIDAQTRRMADTASP